MHNPLNDPACKERSPILYPRIIDTQLPTAEVTESYFNSVAGAVQNTSAACFAYNVP